MRFLFFILLLLFSLNFCFEVRAQIFMPAMRGVISSKPAVTTTMYSGGIGNGANIKSIIQSICPPLDVESIFYGGTGYSSSEKNLMQSNCPPLDIESIFYGGTGYSSSEKNLIQSNCPPLEIESIFYGGTGYSSSEKNLIQATCTPLGVESIYKGGIGYGDAFLFKDNCTSQVSSNLIRSYDVSNQLSYPGSGTTLGDVSGNSVDGTLVNGVGYNNSNGGSLVFDGNDDYVSFSSGFSSTDNLTYEAWVNPSSLGGWGVLLNHDSWNTGYIHFQFAGNLLQFALNGESDKYSTYSFNTNTWYQVAAVYSKSAKTISFYVNGTLTNTENYNNPPTITNSSLKLGSWNGNDRFFNGKIGLVRIYNSALSASDIQTNFNGSKTRFGL
jgi:hypothetical protein